MRFNSEVRREREEVKREIEDLEKNYKIDLMCIETEYSSKLNPLKIKLKRLELEYDNLK